MALPTRMARRFPKERNRGSTKYMAMQRTTIVTSSTNSRGPKRVREKLPYLDIKPVAMVERGLSRFSFMKLLHCY